MNIRNLITSPTSKIRKIAIAFTLFFLWIGLTFWYIIEFDKSALVLSYNHKEENFTQITHDRLLKGERLAGEFTAREENLGIVALRFEKLQRIPYEDEDILVFRIREKGMDEWYYENEYRSGLTFDVPFLPFGFPKISDSKGKKYYFEVESLRGDRQNGVILSIREPFLMSKYQADRATLASDTDKLADFGFKKFFNSFNTIDIVYSSFVFALPLVFYLTYLSLPPSKIKLIENSVSKVKKEFKKQSKTVLGKYYASVAHSATLAHDHWMVIVLVGTILVDILLLQVLNDLLYIAVIGLWIAIVNVHKKDNRMSFAIGLLFLIIAPITYELNNLGIAEKAASWAFMFFVGGTLQAMIELRKSEK